MSELKCCPFCGGEARLYGNSKPIGARVKHYQVAVCTNDDCGCRTSPCETVEDAIYKWNTRAPMDNIVEKLEERERYLEKAMKESHENGHRFSEEKAMNERVAIRYAINIVKQEINKEN